MKKENVEKYVEREKMLQDIEYAFIQDLINLRHEKGLTQQELADMSSVIRTTVARIENGMTSPQVNTLIKMLEPIGYTIKIVPIEKTNIYI